MTIENNQRIRLLLAYDEFYDKVRNWFIDLMLSQRENWEDLYIEKFDLNKRNIWQQKRMNGKTFKNLIELIDLSYFIRNNKELFPHFERKTLNKFPTWLIELQELRNSVSHYQDDLSEDEFIRVFSNMKVFAKAIGEKKLYENINNIQNGKTHKVKNKNPEVYLPVTKGKYLPLQKYFDKEMRKVIKLTIREIEDILNDKLPPSAFIHQPWWGNDKSMKTHPQKRTWVTNSYKVVDKNLDFENHSGYIVFEKAS
ncbi:MAG: Swt1 family HEPN domain-containing protein [Cyclobacteriaceae bacterium]